MRCDAPMLHSWPYPMANFPQRALQEATSYSTCADDQNVLCSTILMVNPGTAGSQWDSKKTFWIQVLFPRRLSRITSEAFSSPENPSGTWGVPLWRYPIPMMPWRIQKIQPPSWDQNMRLASENLGDFKYRNRPRVSFNCTYNLYYIAGKRLNIVKPLNR